MNEPITPGVYRTRNGRTAVVLDTNPTMADGHLEPDGRSKRRGCSWWTKDGTSAGHRKAFWDLVERVGWKI